MKTKKLKYWTGWNNSKSPSPFKKYSHETLKKYGESKKKKKIKSVFKEEVMANNVGGGNIAGLGIGPKGEPGLSKSKIIRRKFAGKSVFEVDTHYFMNCRMGKKKYHRYDRYVGNDEIGEEIRQYGRNNPSEPIILQDNRTGAMIYLKH